MCREMDVRRAEARSANVEWSRERGSRRGMRAGQCPPLTPLGELQLDTRLSRSNTTRPPLESG